MQRVYLISATHSAEFLISGASVILSIWPINQKWKARRLKLTLDQGRSQYKKLSRMGYVKW